MTEEQIAAICQAAGEQFIHLYEQARDLIGKELTITALTGTLAACALAEGYDRAKIVNALNSAMDDIQG